MSRKTCEVDQKQYALGIKKIAVTKSTRKKPEDPVTEVEGSALRAGNGRLSWLAEHTRPDP
eukprot:1537067-Karenia_brevis.AAC.1